jgi:transglutaminase-like putative cysteine protease
MVSGANSNGMVRMIRGVAVSGAIAGLIVLAGLSLVRVYNGSLLLYLVAGAAVGSVVVSSLLRRAPAWLVAPLSVAAMAGYAIFAVRTSAAAAGVDGDVRTLIEDAARNAVPRLLTALIPVEPQPDTVLAPVVLAWLAGFAGAELAARASRPALALLPPTALYAAALILVGPNAPVVVWQPLAFVALATLGLLAGAAPSGPAAGVRGGLSGIARRERLALRVRMATGVWVGVIGVLAVIAVAAPSVAGRVGKSPTDPRRYVEPPSLDVLDQNPLIRISGWAAEPDQRLFQVAVLRGANPAPTTTPPPTSAAPPTTPSAEDPEVVATESPSTEDPLAGAYDTRLRLAILADWDGVTWHVEADYRGAGRVLPSMVPPPGRVGEAGADQAPPLTIEERITIEGLQGRLMPAVAAPARVDGVRVAYDRSTGSLLHSAPLAAGITYTVTSVNHSVDVNLLPVADVPSGAAVARYLAVGDTVPPDLSRLAEQISAGEGSPYVRALSLEAFLADHYEFAADAPSGHAYPNLRFFLFDEPRAGGRRGTSEQFASAFAALGRLMGLPTRVVVGFRTPVGGGTVTARDALAWPEVLFDEVGWVAFDPMPDADVPPQPLEDEFLPRPTPPTEPPESVEPPPDPTLAPASPTPQLAAPGPGGPDVRLIAGGVGGGVLTLLVAFLVVVVVLRYVVRRRRLNRGSAPRRVLGAWGEVLDALALAGTPPPSHLAAVEVADHAAAVVEGRPTRRPRPAAPRLHDLATKVNAAGFGGPTGEPDELAAHAAAVQAVEYSRALRRRQAWWRRLLWTVDPRPLWRRR